jgi:perosamine synthetase
LAFNKGFLLMDVPIARPDLHPDDTDYVLEVLRSGWLVQGPKVAAFETAWSEFTDSAHSVAVTSCTSGLLLSLAALGFGPDDEAIVPAFTWTATANVVEQLGGRVIFCDVDPRSFNLDTAQVAQLIGPRTRAILPVHLFGLPADLDEIVQIAQDHHLIVIEDAACGFGARIGGRHVGTMGDAGVFSFHPRKAVTTGEGGMITTQNSDLAQQLRSLRDHGATVSDRQRHLGAKPYLLSDHVQAGYNQRMTDLQAALGVAQMARANQIAIERQRLAKRYDQALENLEWLQCPTSPPGIDHGYQSYVCNFVTEGLHQDSINRTHKRRNRWMEQLLSAGVSTRPGTHAVHALSYYRSKYDLDPFDYPAAWFADQCSVALPFFNGMTEDEQDHVIDVVSREKP